MTKNTNEQGFISAVYEEKTHEDLHTCLFACFLSQEEPKRISKALSDPAWVEAMQEDILQFKLQKVWILVDFPKEQERIGYEKALRLQEQLDEEERQRIAIAQKEASAFNVEEWDDIQAQIKADEEFAQRLEAEER
ncbi:hypothetical protein Tco_0359513 [Tanacetum coccineum]